MNTGTAVRPRNGIEKDVYDIYAKGFFYLERKMSLPSKKYEALLQKFLGRNANLYKTTIITRRVLHQNNSFSAFTASISK